MSKYAVRKGVVRSMLGSSSEIKVRRSKLADTRALADVFRASWQHAYSGIIPHLHLENVVRRRGPEWWRRAIRSGENLLTLEVNGSVAGYATLGIARTRGQAAGEIYELYLSPTYQGLGFGEHLFEACRQHLDQRRLKGLIVWVLAENTPAIDFYWRRGGRPVARAHETFGSTKVEKIAFTWT
jgi:ribosomal protein S18 acetylase RimI-like enzyme